ncbi:hypothetical protein BD626DRAFT_513151 [Schizophyllum amplum]|uniref:Uncharacterized protein n=1 Tax=Schizophyllum amplum TaxID=97359 RepID=A0A550BZD7_9AGAR|nr:hypothetical protein BD626DRAFT_513151 [Auriculariopsis ampla]
MPGFLSTTPKPAQRVDPGTDILLGTAYSYFVNSDKENDSQDCPLVFSFRSWQWPGTIPDHWSRALVCDSVSQFPLETASDSDMSKIVRRDDGVCIITNYIGSSALLLYVPVYAHSPTTRIATDTHRRTQPMVSASDPISATAWIEKRSCSCHRATGRASLPISSLKTNWTYPAISTERASTFRTA